MKQSQKKKSQQNKYVVGKIDPARKTYFYKRQDGSVFACEIKEALLIHDKYEQYGVSDGKEYQRVLMEAKQDGLEPGAAVGQALKAEQEAAKGHFEKPEYVVPVVGKRDPGLQSELSKMING